MKVKELITKLLDCNMNKDIALVDYVPYTDEIFGKVNMSLYDIENIIKDGIIEIEFDSSEKINYVLDEIKIDIIKTANNIKSTRSDGNCFFTDNDILKIIDKHKKHRER